MTAQEIMLVRESFRKLEPMADQAAALFYARLFELDPSLRRDYTLTNARGVFGPLMTEYVFGYLLAHERLMFDKHASQRAGRWDPRPPGTPRSWR